jgi:hypothetical protein
MSTIYPPVRTQRRSRGGTRTSLCLFFTGFMSFIAAESIARTARAEDNRPKPKPEIKCEPVATGVWYCVIDGEDYWCDTNNNPDPKKNCIDAEKQFFNCHTEANLASCVKRYTRNR